MTVPLLGESGKRIGFLQFNVRENVEEGAAAPESAVRLRRLQIVVHKAQLSGLGQRPD